MLGPPHHTTPAPTALSSTRMANLTSKALDILISLWYIFIRYISRRCTMSKENKSRYAILGILSQGPMSGYAIKKFIEASISNFWNESYGQIYPILKQLSEEGLTSTHAEKQEGKPERYV